MLAVLSHQAGGLTTKYLKGEGIVIEGLLLLNLVVSTCLDQGASYAPLLLLLRPCASRLFQLYFIACLFGEHADASTTVFTV